MKRKLFRDFKVKEVVATAVLAALVFVLLRYVSIPTPLPDTTLSVHDAITAFFAILFGADVAFLGAVIGHLFVDISSGWGIWWAWIIASGVYGLIVGIFCKFDIENGEFNKKEIIRFNIVQSIAAVICWGLIAPVGDIVFYGEPADKVFLQGIFVGISVIVAVGIIGTLILKAYARSRAQKGSLRKS